MKRMTSSNYNPCVNCIYSSSCSHIKYNAPVCPERARYDRLADIEDILGNEYDLDLLQKQIQAYREGRYIILKEPEQAGVSRLRELAQADREGRCVVLPPDDYTWTIRGDIIRGIIHANCRAAKKEAEAALRREQDGNNK